jgi:NAD(P)-dependent dehydrogenase (short-subunit alcohol dehydrogenase family)
VPRGFHEGEGNSGTPEKYADSRRNAWMQLEGKSAVITGAGSGVGRASAVRFATEGARVVCADVRTDWAKETVRQVEAVGGTAIANTCDVTREDEIANAIGVAVASFGRLDVMFNNVGVSTPRPGLRLEDHSDADWDRLLAINLRSVFYGCKHAVIRFKEQGGGGVIINTGSVAGLVGWGGAVYGATKGAVHQLTKSVAIECALDSIRVNAICPASMPETNFSMPEASRGSQGVPAEHVAVLGSVHPIGRPITPDDIAAAAVYLASDGAANVTGVLLPVDGGYVAR